MLDEEVILKGARNGSERLLILNVLMMTAIPTILFGGNSELAHGLFIALGILAPLNVIKYKNTWIDAPPSTLPLYLLALSPYIAALVIDILSVPILNSPGGNTGVFWRLSSPSYYDIVSASDSALTAVTSDLVTLAAVACGLSIFFITDSRYIIRRMFFFASSGAAILVVISLIYDGIESIPGFILPSLGKNSFATFTDASQWSAFAILWMGAALVIAAYSSQRFRLTTFLFSLKFLSLITASVLLGSVLYCGTPLEKTVALFLTSAGYAIIFLDTVPTKSNLARHWTSKYVGPKHKWLRLLFPAACYATLSVLFLAASAWIGTDSWNNPNERLIVSENSHSRSLAERISIIKDCERIVDETPLTGWGTNSFPTVFAFRQGADLGDMPIPSPYSDILQKFIENGIAGLILAMITPLAFGLRWLWRRDFSKSGALMFMTLAGTLLLGVFSHPFQSSAVLISFWVVMMSAFKWDDCQIR